MIESRRSLAVNTALFILLILAAVIIVPMLAPATADAASPAPSGGIGQPITGTPEPTGYEPPAVWSTPPPTDTTVTVTLTDGGWLSVLVLTGSAVVGLLVTLRRLPR